MKKLFAALTATMLLTILAVGCASGGEASSQSEAPVVQSMPDSPYYQVTDGLPDGTTITEQVLVDNEAVKITAKRLGETDYDEGLMAVSLLLQIENKSDVPLNILAQDTAINNYMIDAYFTAEVPAGQAIEEVIRFDAEAMQVAATITKVESLDVTFFITSGDEESSVYETDSATIKTSAYATGISEAPADTDLLYETDDGLSLSFAGTYTSVLEDEYAVFYLENASDKYVAAWCEDFIINGAASTSMDNSPVLAGKSVMLTLRLDEGGYELMQFAFRIVENGNDVIDVTLTVPAGGTATESPSDQSDADTSVPAEEEPAEEPVDSSVASSAA